MIFIYFPDFGIDITLEMALTRDATKYCVFWVNEDSDQLMCPQACAFRDSYEKFKKAGAEVLGISGDDVSSHKVTQMPIYIYIYMYDSIIYEYSWWIATPDVLT